MLSNGPGLRREPDAGDAAPRTDPPTTNRSRLVLALVVVVLLNVAGATWGMRQYRQAVDEASQSPPAAPLPLLLSVSKAATDEAPVRGTFAADLPHTVCAALIDWPQRSTSYASVQNSLPCADGSEVRAQITRRDSELLKVQLDLADPAPHVECDRLSPAVLRVSGGPMPLECSD